MGLISVPQAPEDRKRCGAVRVPDHDLLEAAFQGGVLSIFPVFVSVVAPTTRMSPRPRAGLMMLAASMAPSAPRAHNGMQLIQKEDHVPGFAYLGEDVFHPLLKFSPVLGARHHGGEIQGDEPFATQVVRHLAGDNAPGEPLPATAVLPTPGSPDEGRVVFLSSG